MKPIKNKSFISRVVLLIVGIALLIEIPICVRHIIPMPSNADWVVYVTKTGECYHKAGCQYLSRSRIEKSLYYAAKHYDRCSVCKPPVLQHTKKMPTPAEYVTSVAIPIATAGVPFTIYKLFESADQSKKKNETKKVKEREKFYIWFFRIGWFIVIVGGYVVAIFIRIIRSLL